MHQRRQAYRHGCARARIARAAHEAMRECRAQRSARARRHACPWRTRGSGQHERRRPLPAQCRRRILGRWHLSILRRRRILD
eukprot:2556475-Alexandrium_andersonii.AAC.1